MRVKDLAESAVDSIAEPYAKNTYPSPVTSPISRRMSATRAKKSAYVSRTNTSILPCMRTQQSAEGAPKAGKESD